MRVWLADNPALTVKWLNRRGDWHYPERVEATEPMAARRTNPVAVVSLHRGVAPADRVDDLRRRRSPRSSSSTPSAGGPMD